eukprot:18109_1
MSFIEQHPLLYLSTAIPSKTVLERLVDELHIEAWRDELHIEAWHNKYQLLSSKFDIEVYEPFNRYSIKMHVHNINKQILNSTYQLVDNYHQTETIFIFNQIVHKHLNYTSYKILIKNEKLFGLNDYIPLQNINESIFEHCSNVFANNLKLEKKMVVFDSNSKHVTMNNQQISRILQSKYIITFFNPLHSTTNGITAATVRENKWHVYSFTRIKDLHFIVPYTETISRCMVYIFVQFKADGNFFPIRSIILHQKQQTRVDYLLQLLTVYNHKIENASIFFEKIGFTIENASLFFKKIIQYEPEKLKQKTALGIKIYIIHRLVRELCVDELKPLLRKHHIRRTSLDIICSPLDRDLRYTHRRMSTPISKQNDCNILRRVEEKQMLKLDMSSDHETEQVNSRSRAVIASTQTDAMNRIRVTVEEHAGYKCCMHGVIFQKEKKWEKATEQFERGISWLKNALIDIDCSIIKTIWRKKIEEFSGMLNECVIMTHRQKQQRLRESWTVGSKVEVHSASANRWCQGRIKRIYRDKEGEWLVVQYMIDNVPKQKDVWRWEESSIRSLGSIINLNDLKKCEINATDDNDITDIDISCYGIDLETLQSTSSTEQLEITSHEIMNSTSVYSTLKQQLSLKLCLEQYKLNKSGTDRGFITFLETYLNANYLNKIFAKYGIQKISNVNELSLILNVVITSYKAKAYQMNQNETALKHMDKAEIKSIAIYLSSWIVTKYGNETNNINNDNFQQKMHLYLEHFVDAFAIKDKKHHIKRKNINKKETFHST